MNTPTVSLRRLHALDETQIEELADVLIDCVEGGASVSFMQPLTRERALGFWRKVARGLAAGERALLVACDAHGICGTVQLILEQPENQPHRADLAKLLVHRRARRHGLGAALMRAAEDMARECQKTLLVLDAVTDGDAARLYERLGWERVGTIPDYALMPQGGLCSTTVFFRRLDVASAPRAQRVKPHEHTARVSWSRKGARFENSQYSREHAWSFDGGVSVVASASPSIVPAPWSTAAAIDPEEALVASASSCHMLWFLSLAAAARFVVEEYVDDAAGVLEPDIDGRLAITRIALRPRITFAGRAPSRDECTALHHAAHDHCFIARSLRTRVSVEPPAEDAGAARHA